jgi:hypothetical protein
MSTENQETCVAIEENTQLQQYVTPVVRVLSEAEVLSAFQVTAAGTHSWWAM